MPFWNWSKTANTNASIDPTINWAEGMAPSQVNDSARAMMARIAEFRDDIAVADITTGTSSAYNLVTNQVFGTSPPPNRAMISFVAHTYSAVGATLSLDGGTAYPLWQRYNTAIGAGALQTNVLYTATFFGVGLGWLVHNARSTFNVPIGGIIDWPSATLPLGGNFAFPYGQAISRSTYSELFTFLGTTFGVGDGSTTFNLPNLKGRIVAALDNMGDGASAGVLNLIGSGTTLGAAGGAQTHTIAQANLPNVTLTGGSGSVTASGTTATESADHAHTGSGVTGSMTGANPHTHQYERSQLDGGGSPLPGGGNFQINRPSTATSSTDIDHGHPFSFSTSGRTAAHTHSVTVAGSATGVSVSLGGSGTALNDLPPIMTLNKIIRII